MTEAMIRFNLVGGLVYTLTGDEAVKAWESYRNFESDGFRIQFDEKNVAVFYQHVVSVEWKGVE